MAFDGDNVRAALRNWASGVTVVTSQHSDETPVGITASSFNSVSLEPPLLLICLYKESETALTIAKSGVFGISILGTDQADLSARFAGFDEDFPKGRNRFENLEIARIETGVPLLANALASFDCRVWERHDGSTHDIIIGEVLGLHMPETEGARPPLVYYNRGYQNLSPQE